MQRHYRSIATWLLGGLLGVSCMAFAAPGASATNSVTDVSYGSGGGAFKLTVVADSAVSTQVHKYSVDSSGDIQDLVIDVTPASYDGRTKVIAFSDGPIHQVRVGQLSQSPAVMRIVVESKGAAKYDLNQERRAVRDFGAGYFAASTRARSDGRGRRRARRGRTADPRDRRRLLGTRSATRRDGSTPDRRSCEA